MPPRGWRKQREVQAPLPLPEPYPEHAKLHPHLQDNWAIREFLFWLVHQGRITDLTFDQVNDLLLEYRGVDVDAYYREGQRLKVEYKWLHDQYMPEQESDVKPALAFQMVRLMGRALPRVESEFSQNVKNKVVDRMVEAALPDRSPEDGLTFLLAKIRGGGNGEVGKD